MKTSRERFAEFLGNIQREGRSGLPLKSQDDDVFSTLQKMRASRNPTTVPAADPAPEPDPAPAPDPQPAQAAPTTRATETKEYSLPQFPEFKVNLPLTDAEAAERRRPSGKLRDRQEKLELERDQAQAKSVFPLGEAWDIATSKPEETIRQEPLLKSVLSRVAKGGGQLLEVPADIVRDVNEKLKEDRGGELVKGMLIDGPIEAGKTSFRLGNAIGNSVLNAPQNIKALLTGEQPTDLAGDPELHTDGVVPFLTNNMKDLANMVLAPAAVKGSWSGAKGMYARAKNAARNPTPPPRPALTYQPGEVRARGNYATPDHGTIDLEGQGQLPYDPVINDIPAAIPDGVTILGEGQRALPEPPPKPTGRRAPPSSGPMVTPDMTVPPGALYPELRAAATLGKDFAMPPAFGMRGLPPVAMLRESLGLDPAISRDLAAGTAELAAPPTDFAAKPSSALGISEAARPGMDIKIPEMTEVPLAKKARAPRTKKAAEPKPQQLLLDALEIEPAPEVAAPVGSPELIAAPKPVGTGPHLERLSSAELAKLPREQRSLLKVIADVMKRQSEQSGRPVALDEVADLVHEQVSDFDGNIPVPVSEWPGLYNRTLRGANPKVYSDKLIEALDLTKASDAEMAADIPTPEMTRNDLEFAPDEARPVLQRVADLSPKALNDFLRVRTERAIDPQMSMGDKRVKGNKLVDQLRSVGIDDIASKISPENPEAAAKQIADALDADYAEMVTLAEKTPHSARMPFSPLGEKFKPEWEKYWQEQKEKINADLVDPEVAKDTAIDTKMLADLEAKGTIKKKPGRKTPLNELIAQSKALEEAKLAEENAKKARKHNKGKSASEIMAEALDIYGDRGKRKVAGAVEPQPWDGVDLKSMSGKQIETFAKEKKLTPKQISKLGEAWMKSQGLENMHAGSKEFTEAVMRMGRAQETASNGKFNFGFHLPAEMAREQVGKATARAMGGLLDINRPLGRALDAALGKSHRFVSPVQRFIQSLSPTGMIRQMFDAPAYLKNAVSEVMEHHQWDPKTKSLKMTQDRMPVAAEDFTASDGTQYKAGDSLIGKALEDLDADTLDPLFLKMEKVGRDPQQAAQALRLLNEARIKYGNGADALIEHMIGRAEEFREMGRQAHRAKMKGRASQHAARAQSLRNGATDPNIGPTERAKLLEDARKEQLRADNLNDLDAQTIESYMSRVPEGRLEGDPGFYGSRYQTNMARVRPGNEGKYRSGKGVVADIDPADSYVNGGPGPAGMRPNIDRTLNAISKYLESTMTQEGQAKAANVVKQGAVDMHLDRWRRAQKDGVDSGLRVADKNNPAGREPLTEAEARQAAYELTTGRVPGGMVSHGYGNTTYVPIKLADGSIVNFEEDIADHIIRGKGGMKVDAHGKPMRDVEKSNPVEQVLQDIVDHNNASILDDPTKLGKNAVDNAIRSSKLALQHGVEIGTRVGKRSGFLPGVIEGVKGGIGSMKDMASEIIDPKMRNSGEINRVNLGKEMSPLGQLIEELVPGVGKYANDAIKSGKAAARLIFSGDPTFTGANVRASFRVIEQRLIDKYLEEGMQPSDAMREAKLDVQQAEMLRSNRTTSIPDPSMIREGAMQAISDAEALSAEHLPSHKQAPQFIGKTPLLDKAFRFLPFGMGDLRGAMQRMKSVPKIASDALRGKVDPVQAGRAASLLAILAPSLLWQSEGDEQVAPGSIRVPYGKGSGVITPGRADPAVPMIMSVLNAASNVGKSEDDPTRKSTNVLKSLAVMSEGAIPSVAGTLNDGEIAAGKAFATMIPFSAALKRAAAAENILAGDGPSPKARNFPQSFTKDLPVIGRIVRNLTTSDIDKYRDQVKHDKFGDSKDIELLNWLLSGALPMYTSKPQDQIIHIDPKYLKSW